MHGCILSQLQGKPDLWCELANHLNGYSRCFGCPSSQIEEKREGFIDSPWRSRCHRFQDGFNRICLERSKMVIGLNRLWAKTWRIQHFAHIRLNYRFVWF